MKTPEQWAQEIELRCVADNRRPRIAVEADVIREAVNERLEKAASPDLLSSQDIRLICGELNAQEIRTVTAVLAWRSHAVRWLKLPEPK
jgi:hypothetical protein